MEYDSYSHRSRTLADQHIDDLMEVLEELLSVPELACQPDEVFDYTREIMAKARVVRRAILDEYRAIGTAP